MLKVIFEDEHFLVIDKPAGISTTTSETEKGRTIEDILVKDYQIPALRGGIVHRLDKDTSGLLVVGKSDDIVLKLQTQFKERTVQKEYLALVHGVVKEQGRVDAPIIRNPERREKFTVASQTWSGEAGVREAVTEYEPIQRLAFSGQRLVEIFLGFNKIQFRKLYAIRYTLLTLLACHPLTGRTHQIRVHLKHIGFPIVSDEKYGGRKMVRLDKRWCKRQFLHAAKLGFDHPVTSERLTFESPLPDDLAEALKNLETMNNEP